MKQFIKYIALIVCACSCWACMDDEMGQEIDYSQPATVKLSIDFSDMQVVTPGTRSAGGAIGQMTNLCVLFYDKDGYLAMDGANPIYEYVPVSSVESKNITKTVPAGVYKVVAVANMGNLVTGTIYKEAVKTLEGLKSISLQWNNGAITANNQMFGFFNIATDNAIDSDIAKNGLNKVAPTSYDAPDLTLSGNMTLYAKLYRTVAKVTVAFDGKGLYRNVFVTIKSIRLGNLPATCPLWVENREVRDTLSVKGNGGAQSEILTDANFGLLKVTNRGETESLFPKDAHSQTGPSLFMFENRQGTASTSGDKDKTITKKAYGAFIEIEAFYANEATGSNGKIIYRYMLGEDTPNSYDNYNLTRNRHYKVTLMLQKSGKEEPYWRVDYDENPSINLPTEVNISYRHSAKLDIPFTVTDILGGVKSVSAQIVENPWYDDLDENGMREATVKFELFKAPKYGFLAWEGDQSTNSKYGDNKTLSISVPNGENNTYKLSIQTEPLGYWSDRGGEYEAADAFTGYNNYSNPRTAKIRVTVTYQSGDTKTADVKVVQVPRIVNPVAVYRKWNSEKNFKIRLLNALGAEIESYGPWKAEVESGKDWIGIKGEGNSTYGTSFTSGEAGGAIRFDYKPLSSLNSDMETRCGVIVVRFSNYNVEHRIYVRQGDAPMAIGNRETLWTSFNYIGVDVAYHPQFTDSPMEEGAWLKSGNSLGILANNTDNLDTFENPPSSFKMSNGSTTDWASYRTEGGDDAEFLAPGLQLPTQDDIDNLQRLKDYSGLGIGYDDSATETLVFDEAAQYNNPQMGRRGIVICDAKGRNLFFPTGKRGYGRRRSGYDDGGYGFNGGLHYTNCSNESNFDMRRPALIGLSKAMGAIYWANGFQKLSFNYSISNIELQNRGNGIATDACFARLVIK